MSEKVKETAEARKRSKRVGPKSAQQRRQQRPRTPGQSTISSKNQITLPVEVLRKLGFGPGTRLEVMAGPTGDIILRNADESPGDRVRLAAGVFSGMYPPNYLEDLRRDWDDRP